MIRDLFDSMADLGGGEQVGEARQRSALSESALEGETRQRSAQSESVYQLATPSQPTADDLLAWKEEANILNLSGDQLVAYVSERHKSYHSQRLAETDLYLQHQHRIEEHQLLVDQRTALHLLNLERSAELHGHNVKEAERRTQAASTSTKLRLQPLTDTDSVEDYLVHYERLARLHKWEQETWSLQLAPFLQGRARKAYDSIPADLIDDWQQVKSALLREFQLSASDYRLQFKAASRKQDEPLHSYFERLETLQARWLLLQGKDEDDLPFLLIREKFLESLPEAQRWFMGNRPTSTKKTLIESAQVWEDLKKEQAALKPTQ